MEQSILILDDDVHVRKSLAISLEDEEFTVHEAGSSEEALDMLETTHADLVIVDLRLPGMDGTEFISSARAKWPKMRFIIYTGSPEFRIPAELASVDCVSNSVFLKPLPESEIMISEIRRMLK